MFGHSLTHDPVGEPLMRHQRFDPGKDRCELVVTAPCMKPVFQMMLRASKSQETVLIVGETGTGKELVARSVHEIGALRTKAFLPVDCCTLLPALIESELFGYVRGAFTGANDSRMGLFQAAQGGSIFLDEIGEIPLDLQSKLLRAIQEREIRPVGGTSWVEFDARIIAATNRNLESAMQQGAFRKDLYFRLNVLTIELPPLRKRKEDIPLLANHFLARACEGKGERLELSSNALDCLMAYDWPGNVRELENCIRRAVVWGSGPILHAEDLPLYIRKPAGAALVADLSSGQMIPLQELERQAILHAIANANGDKLIAARVLGIGKTTIYRKLKEYGIS